MEDDGGDEKSLTLQVRFTTKQKEYAISDYPFELAANVGTDELNNLINQALKDDDVIKKTKDFDFLIGGEFLRGTLEELVLRHEAKKDSGEEFKSKIGFEEIFEVEYVERCPAPEPQDCLLHDDWVSCVDVSNDWIITGSYDATIHVWTMKGHHLQNIPGHTSPVKAIGWIHNIQNKNLSFVSGSQDQTLIVWEWDLENNTITSKWVCKGHERSVESVKCDPKGAMFASGSWDGHLKIWSASIEEEGLEKKQNQKAKSRTPIMTLAGHKESISGIDWMEDNEIITSSWDHTLKMWDVEVGEIKSQIPGQKAFFDLSWSPLNNTVITASADKYLRLYDPRSPEGSIVKTTFTSHTEWVSSVNWSSTNENLFISGSYDKLMKLWDMRSPRAPLYSMTGHTDKILCTSWANPDYMMSGSGDNTLRIFKSVSIS